MTSLNLGWNSYTWRLIRDHGVNLECRWYVRTFFDGDFRFVNPYNVANQDINIIL